MCETQVERQFETKHDLARLSRYVHDVGYPCQGPRNQWGYAYSLSSERRMHYKDYEMAGEFMTSGEAARELAVSAEREFEVALTTYLLADDADGSLDAAQALAAKAMTMYVQSGMFFEMAEAIYQRIRNQHPETPGYWAHYKGGLPG